jgi:hypothetical protein
MNSINLYTLTFTPMVSVRRRIFQRKSALSDSGTVKFREFPGIAEQLTIPLPRIILSAKTGVWAVLPGEGKRKRSPSKQKTAGTQEYSCPFDPGCIRR